MKTFEEGDFYWSPEGYRVFTEQYLKRRGYCCKSGCKHCPYGYDKNTHQIIRTPPSKEKGGEEIK